MKYLIPFIFLLISSSSFGQTKEGLIECLELIFSEDKFQPAFSNDASNGFVVIMSQNGGTGYRHNTPKINQIVSSLTQDDFYDSDHRVKVVSQVELERLGISEHAVLRIFASGGEDEITIGLQSNIQYENLNYLWSYNMKKNDEDWEIIGSSVSTQKSVITQW